MANQHQHIDLTTLKEVERLLTSAEISAADEAATRTGLGSASAPLSARSSDLGAGPAEGLSALPRRR